MLKSKTHEPTSRKPLRLWPGVVAAVLMWLLRYVFPMVAPDDVAIYGVFAGLAFGVVIVVWCQRKVIWR